MTQQETNITVVRKAITIALFSKATFSHRLKHEEEKRHKHNIQTIQYKSTFILLLNIQSKSYLKLIFVTHLYFSRDSVHCVIPVVLLLAAFPLDEFEEGERWDG